MGSLWAHTGAVGCIVLIDCLWLDYWVALSPQTLVPSGVFDMDKLMAALAYQVDPQSVEVDDYTMFRPRKKSSVLSSR